MGSVVRRVAGVLGCLAILVVTSTAQAVPTLQVYLEGATYDTATETWVADIGDPLRLWVIGNVGSHGTISNVRLAVGTKVNFGKKEGEIRT